MKNKLSIFLFFSLFIQGFYGQIWPRIPSNNALSIESSFRNGEYEKTDRLSNKILKSGHKERKDFTALSYLYQIQITLLKTGDFDAIKKLHDQYHSLLKDFDSPSHHFRIEYLAKLSIVYAQNGYSKPSKKLLDEAYQLLSESPSDDVKNNLDLSSVHYHFSVMNFKTAINLIESQKVYRKKLISDSYSYRTPSGNLLTGEMSKKQKSANLRDYADYLNLEVNAYFLYGSYVQADSMATSAYYWMKENLDKKGSDVAFFDNRLIVIQLHKKLSQESLGYQFIINKEVGSKAGLHPSVDKKNDGFSYYENSDPFRQMEAYKAQHYWRSSIFNIGAKSVAEGIYSKQHSWINRFGEHGKNLNIYLAEKLLIEKHYVSGNYGKAKAILDTMINKKDENNKYFWSEEHPFRREMLLIGIELDHKTDNSKDLFKKIKQLEACSRALFESSTPIYKHDKLYATTYSDRMSGDKRKALELFNSTYYNDFEKELFCLHPQKKLFANEAIRLQVTNDKPEMGLKQLENELNEMQAFKFRDPNGYAQYLCEKASIKLKLGDYKESSRLLEINKESGPIYSMLQNSDFDNNFSQDQFYRTITEKHILYGDYISAKKTFSSIKSKTDYDFVHLAEAYIYNYKISAIKEKLYEIYNRYELNGERNSDKVLELLYKLALTEAMEGDFNQSSKFNIRALELSTQLFGTKSQQYALACYSSGLTSSLFGDYKNAYIEFKKASELFLSIFGEKNILYIRSFVEMNMAMLYNNERKDQVEFNLLKASNLVKNSMGYATFENASILKNLSFYYLSIGKIDAAERDLAQSSQILSDLGEKTYESLLAQNFIINSQLATANKQYKESESSLKKALGYLENLYPDDNHIDITSVKSQLARLYYMQGEKRDSRNQLNKTTSIYLQYIDKYFSYLTDREKQEFWKKISEDFEFYKTIAFEDNNPKDIETVYNNALTTKGILLNSTKHVRQVVANSKDPEIKQMYNQWNEKHQLLSHAISLSNEQLKEENVDLEQLQRDIDKLEKNLSEKSNEFKQISKGKITWEQVRDKLLDNEFAVEIIRYKKFKEGFTDSIGYKALILGKGFKTPKVVNLGNGNLLEGRYIFYYRNMMKFQKRDLLSYKIFYKPIYEVVGSGAKVFLSCDGVYNLMNVETMRLDTNIYVLDKNDINLVASTRDILKEEKANSKSKEALILSNPMFYAENISSNEHLNVNPLQTIKQLEGAEKEGYLTDSTLQKYGWNSKVLSWNLADETVIKRLNTDRKAPSYLHIATHGYFEAFKQDSDLLSKIGARRGLDDPYLRSGIIMLNGGDVMQGNDILNYNVKDGVLTAKEISSLDLSGVDLCVLSACETGLGDVSSGEGVYGMQRAFLSAGVKEVIISLFRVDDNATQYFMTHLAAEYSKKRDAKKAMFYAKKETQKVYPDSKYWGSFILVQ